MALHSHSHADNATAPAAGTNSTAPAAGTNSTAASSAPVKNTTNVVGALSSEDVIISAAPYEVKRCDQVIMLEAKRLGNQDDYTSRASGFFTISAYLINMFESKDNNKLLESINLAHIKTIPSVLQGSKTCLSFQDGYSFRNISLCLDNESTLQNIQKAYSNFMNCRMGGDLKDFDPVTINNILTASCNGFNSTEGVKYDMPKIRAQMTEELKKAGVK